MNNFLTIKEANNKQGVWKISDMDINSQDKKGVLIHQMTADLGDNKWKETGKVLFFSYDEFAALILDRLKDTSVTNVDASANLPSVPLVNDVLDIDTVADFVAAIDKIDPDGAAHGFATNSILAVDLGGGKFEYVTVGDIDPAPARTVELKFLDGTAHRYAWNNFLQAAELNAKFRRIGQITTAAEFAQNATIIKNSSSGPIPFGNLHWNTANSQMEMQLPNSPDKKKLWGFANEEGDTFCEVTFSEL